LVVVTLVLAASALPIFLYIRHRQTKQFEAQLAEIKRARSEEARAAAAAEQEATEPKVEAAKPARRKKAKAGDVNRPVLTSGSPCFVERRGQDYEGVIEKVHYDDTPPYYTVKLTDGTVVDTVRSRIESRQERADACAAALLEEEEQAARKKGKATSKPSSGHDKTVAKGAKKKSK